MKNRLITAISALIFFIGLSAFVYPVLSDFINSRNHSKIIADYESVANNFDDDVNIQLLDAADKYNDMLYNSVSPLYNPESIENYENILDISGTGIIGYITIEKLKLKLPIYHGTSAGVLNAGIGHIEGSSLPVGGVNTHSSLTGHRGLPNSVLFTDLDKLKIGDKFVITVLTRTLVYTVDSILVVKPHEIESLFIQEGEDLCTLVTCTPYGVNSHRLLVRGIRSQDILGEETPGDVASDTQTVFRLSDLAILFAAVMFLTWVIVYIFRQRGNKTGLK